jgi:hypothetical protein
MERTPPRSGTLEMRKARASLKTPPAVPKWTTIITAVGAGVDALTPS